MIVQPCHHDLTFLSISWLRAYVCACAWPLRIVVHGAPTNRANDICRATMALVSLMPGFLQQGLDHVATRDFIPAKSSKDISVESPLQPVWAQAGCPLDLYGNGGILQPHAVLQQVRESSAAR